MPLPSTMICPSLPLAVAASGLAAGAFDAEVDGDADATVVLEQPARATTASAEPARVRMSLVFMMGSFWMDCVEWCSCGNESFDLPLNNGPHPPRVHAFSKFSADRFGFGAAERSGDC